MSQIKGKLCYYNQKKGDSCYKVVKNLFSTVLWKVELVDGEV